MFHTPEIVREIYRVLLAAKTAAGLPKAGEIDFLPFGVEACRPGCRPHQLCVAARSNLAPDQVEELFDTITRALGR
jgi:hypothetical protein